MWANVQFVTSEPAAWLVVFGDRTEWIATELESDRPAKSGMLPMTLLSANSIQPLHAESISREIWLQPTFSSSEPHQGSPEN